MLFQGEEWGASTPFQYFAAHEDAALGRRVREGRRREFAGFDRRRQKLPDPQAEATFERCKLDWSERNRAPHAELLEWHGSLIRLRRGTPALTDGRRDLVDVHFDEHARWLVVERGPITVACNLAEHTQRIPIGSDARRIKLASQASASRIDGSVELPAESVAILTTG